MSWKKCLVLVFYNSIFAISAIDTGTCGKFPESNFLDNRVVGGTPTRENEVPWIASLWNDGNHHCGGSLITRQHVLTAAHCLDRGIEPWNLKVHLGAWDLSNPRSSQIVGVEEVMVHNEYKPATSKHLPENDIAIIKLDQEVRVSEQVWPICLPITSASLSSIRNGIVAGWGTTAFGGASSDILLKVILMIHGNDVCSRAFNGRKVSPTHLCAGFLGGGKDACQGDSGGPLYASLPSGTDPKWTLLGIVSAGEGCAKKDKLGLYTRVSEYLNWIREHTDDALSLKEGESGGEDEKETFEWLPRPVVKPETQKQQAVTPKPSVGGGAKQQLNFLNVFFGPKKEEASTQPPVFLTTNKPMSPCIQCICQGSTGCSSKANSTSWIGPFAMGKLYWLDGGENRVSGDTFKSLEEAYERCAKDTACAVKTVQSYIARYKKDCNLDGVINCDDFARLHLRGPFSCNDPVEGTGFWNRYSQCKSSVDVSDLNRL